MVVMRPWEFSWAQNAPEEIEVWGDDLQQDTLRFNLRWVAPWRLLEDGEICSGDAAWIFVKVKLGRRWQTACVSTKAEEFEVPDDCVAVPTDDGAGVFVHIGPSFPGFEKAAVDGCVQLQLQESYPDDTPCQVFALRMVYIPKIEFWLGSSHCNGAFYDARPSALPRPYRVASEDAIEVTEHYQRAGTGKRLHYASPPNDQGRYGDRSGPIPAAFPKGHQAFYVMRSHVTQGQYADFINTLLGDERTLRFPYAAGAYRYTIRMDRNLFRIALRPRRACNYLSWADATAYAAWAGLRPMTELEFEKACVHKDDPVPQKYAWGTRNIFPAQVIQSRASMTVVVGNCNTGNRHMEFDGGDGDKGPVRDDEFAIPGTLEEKFHGFGGLLYGESFGATYLGVLGMSGNLWDLCVTVGNAEGRRFTGRHGDGSLRDGSAPLADLEWPQTRGFGFRGGSWYTGRESCRVADRMHATALGGNYVYRSHDVGFRAVRTAPRSEQHAVKRLKSTDDLEETKHRSLKSNTAVTWIGD